MKTSPLLAALLLLGAPVTLVLANPVPKHSTDHATNQKTLTEDQGATPQVADCIATGYDLVHAHQEFDRLGFTRNDIAGADMAREKGPFSSTDPRPVSEVVVVSGEARQRGYGSWLGVTLRCGYAGHGLTAIEIVADQAQD